MAVAAFIWLEAAKASWSTRETPNFSATFSAVTPMEANDSGQEAIREGFALNLIPPIGIIVILSAPPAMMQSANPAMMRSAAEAIV